MGLDFDVDAVKQMLENLRTDVINDLDVYCSTAAASMESYAKQHRPWTDRTGQARVRLRGTASRSGETWEIKLSHGVDYGVYLEQAHEKRYAIIEPTILSKSPEIMNGFKNYLERISSQLK